MTGLLDAALEFHAAGACVIPAMPDGEKRPAVDWKVFQGQRPSEDQIRAWFTGNRYDGFGIVCGAISGGLEMLEFEGRAIAEGYFDRFTAALADHGMKPLMDRIAGGYAERTPSGGLHFLYRVDGELRKNTKLASRPSTPEELAAWKARQQAGIDAEPDPDRRAKRQHTLDGITRGDQVPQVLIETRGEGGFVVTAPSGGRTHPTGRAWSLITGGPDTIATITEDEREALHAIATLFDEMPAPEPSPRRTGTAGPRDDDDELRPGDDFNARADWSDILTPHGWTPARNYGQALGWRRPGKDRGVSATTGTNEADNLYVFSSSTIFETEKPYSKFGAYALLEHGGDHTAAARDLRRQGYGGERRHDDEDLEDLIADPPAGTGGTGGEPPKGGSDQPAGPPGGPQPAAIDISDEPAAITGITTAIRADALPDCYVRNGNLVQIVNVSGDALADQPNALTQAVVDVTAESLRRLLAEHAQTYRLKHVKDGAVRVPSLPTVATAKSVLSATYWADVRPLINIVAAPVMRPDGTILQDEGYDPATRLYYSPSIDIPRIPDVPDVVDVRNARALILDQVLGDFPWADDASRANFVALFISPLLRPYIGGVTPLGAISATERGSGKTLLTDVIGMLYGATSRAWTSNDEELRKAITATLKGTSNPVVTFDNVGEFDIVAAPTLAKLLTSNTWNDRELGTNNEIGAPNDRLWLVTGNNIQFGGDIGQRTVLVSLDPRCPRPDLRTGFRIPDLGAWLEEPTNRARLLYALLVLARDWVCAGAPRVDVPMRGFRRWVQAAGGLVHHHGLGGFLANRDELAEHDEEAVQWAAFLAAWHGKFGETPQTCAGLLRSAEVAWGGLSEDPWSGAFITRADGSKPSAKGLGKMLTAKRGRFFGEYFLHGDLDRKSKVWMYHVEQRDITVAEQGSGAWGEAA